MQICQRCVLPETFPGVSFDDDGLCRLCRNAPPAADIQAKRGELRQRMQAVFDALPKAGDYDCLVAFSGGKDSSYTLKLLVEQYELRCLAMTIDNGFLSAQAVKNCRAVTSSLGVDFTLFTPAPEFMKKLYRVSAESDSVHTKAAVTRASAMCNSCISLINARMMQTALQQQIPVIAGGYIGGQVPKDAAVLEFDLAAGAKSRELAMARYASHFGPESERYFGVNATGGPAKLTIINPMLTVLVSEEEIIEDIAQIGWKPAKDTGRNSSNCRLNDLGILVHFRQHGFNPYVAEIAEQVRVGLMDRETGLAKSQSIPEPEDVKHQAQTIGIELQDLRKSA